MSEVSDIQRCHNALTSLVVCMILLQAAVVVGLGICAGLLSTSVQTATREETIAQIRAEMYEPLMAELQTLAEGINAADPGTD